MTSSLKTGAPPQRRRHERFAAEVPVRITVPDHPARRGGGGPRFEAHLRTRDLSFGGAFLASPFQFAKDPPAVVIELALPDETVKLTGRVVRKSDGGMGVAFDEMKPKAREAVLRHFVPPEHRAFHAHVAKSMGADVPVEKLSLILHAWDEWRST